MINPHGKTSKRGISKFQKCEQWKLRAACNSVECVYYALGCAFVMLCTCVATAVVDADVWIVEFERLLLCCVGGTRSYYSLCVHYINTICH
jgi:hypothetical protein